MSTKKKTQVQPSAFDQFFALLANETTFETAFQACLKVAENDTQVIQLTTVDVIANDPAKLEMLWNGLMNRAQGFEGFMVISGLPVFHSNKVWVETLWRALVSAVRTQDEIDRLVALPLFADRKDTNDALFPARYKLAQTVAQIADLVRMYPNQEGRIWRLVNPSDLTEDDILLLSDACPAWKPELYKQLMAAAEAQLEKVLTTLGRQQKVVAQTEATFNAASVQVTAQLGKTEEAVTYAQVQLGLLNDDADAAERAGREFDTARVDLASTVQETDRWQQRLIGLQHDAGMTGPLMPFIRNVPNHIILRGLQNETSADAQPVKEPVLPETPASTPVADVKPVSMPPASLDSGIVARFRVLFKKIGDMKVTIPIGQ